MQLSTVRIEKPDDVNVILGQSHFIKTIEDLHEVLAGTSMHLKFGIAFCESSGPRLVRRSGNDQALVDLATRAALAVAAGHFFAVFLREGFDIQQGLPFETRLRIKIPLRAMHSFTSDHNKVEWKLVVKGAVARWPDFERGFPVVIRPESAASEAA